MSHKTPPPGRGRGVKGLTTTLVEVAGVIGLLLGLLSVATTPVSGSSFPPGTPQLNIAIFLYQNTSQRVLDPNVTLVASGLDSTQANFLRGYKLWRDSINTMGGITLFNNVTVAANITFFCPGPMSAITGDSEIIPRASALLTDITNGVFGGPFPVFIANPLSSTPMNTALMTICETTQKCVFIHPLSATTQLFVCAGAGTPLSDICRSKNRRAGGRQFDYSWTTFPAEGQTFTPFVNLMVNKGLKSLVYLSSPFDAFAPASTAVGIATAQSLGIDVKLVQVLTAGWTNDQYSAFVANISTNYNPDALALMPGTSSSNTPLCTGIIKNMKAQNWFPKAGFIGGCLGTMYNADAQIRAEDMTKYWFSSSPWDERLRGQQFRVFSALGSLEPFEATTTEDSPQVFARLLRARYGNVPTGSVTFAALGAFACMMAQKALEVNPTLVITPETINAGLRSLSQPSHLGTMQFDQWGRLVPVTFTFSQIGDALSINLQAPIPGGVEPIVPIPNWSERYYSRTALYETPAEFVVVALTTACIAYAAGLLLFILYHRKNGVILAATPVFCAFTLVGSIVMMSANYVWTTHETDDTCRAKVWLLQRCEFIPSLKFKNYRWSVFRPRFWLDV